MLNRIKVFFGAVWITLQVVFKVIGLPFMFLYGILRWILVILFVPFALLYALITYKKDE